MNEQEWLVSDDPARMLHFVAGEYGQLGIRPETYSARKLRLFACACAELDHGPGFVEGSKWSEWLDGNPSKLESPHYVHHGLSASQTPKGDALAWTTRMAYSTDAQYATRQKNQAALLREIFGNPFRPVKWRTAIAVPAGEVVATYSSVERILAWNNALIPRLAAAIYEERRFEDMPILADELENAGCANQDILMHCRGMVPDLRWKTDHDNNYSTWANYGWRKSNTSHVRGCWVIDLLLGKE